MKIQIVYLSPEDDIHSARDMLSWVKAPRALLVWPDRGKVLSRQLDLVLLQRYCQQRKIKMGLLTFETDIRTRAKALGIPVFESLDELPEANWNIDQVEVSSYEKPPVEREEYIPKVQEASSRDDFRGLSKKVKMYFTCFGIILGLLLCVLYFPSATIDISPERTKQSMQFELPSSTNDLDEEGSVRLPLKLEALKISGSTTGETSGISHVSISKAEGNVTFTNLSSQALTIPVNTVVRTSAEGGVRFRTTKPASLLGENGAEVVVPIEAVTMGRRGNVPMNSITYIEGSLGLILEVNNLKSLKGGKDEIRGRVLQEDLDQLQETLIAELAHQAETQFKNSLFSDQILVEGSIEPGEIFERRFSHDVGESTESVTLELTQEFVASSLSRYDLKNYAYQVLAGTVSEGDDMARDSMIIKSVVVSTNGEGGDPRILVTVEFDTYSRIDSETIKDAIRGRSMSGAFSRLRDQITLAFDPEIKIEPDWFPILPLLNTRIDLRWEGK